MDPVPTSARARAQWSHAVPYIAGVLLLAAAALKMADATPLWALVRGRAGVAAYAGLLAVETAVGLALLSAPQSGRVRFLGAAVFAAFAGYALWLAVGGAASCGCFGAVRVNPWVTAAVDSLLAVLLVTRARTGSVTAAGRPSGARLAALAACVAITAGVAVGQYRHGVGERDGRTVELTVDEPLVELGRIRGSAAGQIKRTFVLRNPSLVPIEIDRIEKSCTCTSSTLSKTVLAPGEEAVISVDIDWTGRRGPQRSDLWVTTKQQFGAIPLAVTGTVDVGIAASPRAIHLGELTPGEVVRRRVSVVLSTEPSNSAEPAVKVTRYAAAGVTAVEIPPDARRGAAATYDLVFDPAVMPPGRTDAGVTFAAAGHPDLPPVVVPVSYSIRPPLVSDVPTLRFRPGSTSAQTVKFARRDGRKAEFRVRPAPEPGGSNDGAFVIVSVTESPSEYTVTLGPAPGGKEAAKETANVIIAFIEREEVSRVALLSF